MGRIGRRAGWRGVGPESRTRTGVPGAACCPCGRSGPVCPRKASRDVEETPRLASSCGQRGTNGPTGCPRCDPNYAIRVFTPACHDGLGSIVKPRRFTSKSNSRQDWALSRWPSVMAIRSFGPYFVAPISTRMHCRSSSKRMLTWMPSALTYPYALPSKQRRERLPEVAPADAFEVQVGDQLLHALGLPQVRWEQLGVELLPLRFRPAISHARLLHRHFARGGDQLPLGQVAVADHPATATVVGHVLMLVDPLGDFRFNGLG